MSLSVGIVGLPNVGKSTLFNALLGKQQALAANYPFATVEPNVGVVPVPDARLERLASVIRSQLQVPSRPAIVPADSRRDPSASLRMNGPQIVPAAVQFVDIAGLVKGAASGEGLGNKFLANIREVDLVCHVLRDFADGEVVRAGAISPEEDYQTVEAELIMKDLETVGKQTAVVRKQEPGMREFAERLFSHLDSGKPARRLVMTDKEREWVEGLFLLTMKDEVAVINVGEDQLSGVGGIEKEMTEKLGIPAVALCAKVEAEFQPKADGPMAQAEKEAALELLNEYGIKESGLDRLIRLSYGSLGLISFLTAGEKEVRAWTVKEGSKAPEAAGVIHTDFVKKFIKAKVCNYDDFVEGGGWKGAAEKGRVRMEGRDYVVREGDVIEFMVGS